MRDGDGRSDDQKSRIFLGLGLMRMLLLLTLLCVIVNL